MSIETGSSSTVAPRFGFQDFANIFEYSGLTGTEDEVAVETLKIQLGALKKVIREHGVRIVDTAVDAIMLANK